MGRLKFALQNKKYDLQEDVFYLWTELIMMLDAQTSWAPGRPAALGKTEVMRYVKVEAGV